MKKTLVFGASPNQDRYSNKAVRLLIANGHPVVAVALRPSAIDQTPIITPEQVTDTDIDTISMYVGPQNQTEHYNFLLQLSPKRIIFNPGTENDEFAQIAHKQGIETEEACTLVLLNTKSY